MPCGQCSLPGVYLSMPCGTLALPRRIGPADLSKEIDGMKILFLTFDNEGNKSHVFNNKTFIKGLAIIQSGINLINRFQKSVLQDTVADRNYYFYDSTINLAQK